MSALKGRVLDAALVLVATHGWSGLTMARLATATGVSRQSVYAAVGDKAGLAAALVDRELAGFLRVVEAELDRGEDVEEALRRTVTAVLTLAEQNVLVASAISASHGQDVDEVLPLLTTRSEPVLAAARAVLARGLTRFHLALGPEETEVFVDAVVRLVMSYVMRPGPGGAERVGTVAARLLATG